MAEKVYGYPAKDVARINRAVVKSEREATDLTGTPLRRRVQPGGSTSLPLVCKLIATDTGTEVYSGRIKKDDGSYPTSDDAQVINLTDYLNAASGSHALDLPQEVVCVDTGQLTAETTPRRILTCQGGRYAATPVTTLAAGSGLTLETTEWDLYGVDMFSTGNTIIKGAVKVAAWRRSVWDNSEFKVKSIGRTPTYDAGGILRHIGPEQFVDSITYVEGCGF